MQSGTNFTEFLPIEVILTIGGYLDLKTFVKTMPELSKSSYSIFADPRLWRIHLTKEFGISEALLDDVFQRDLLPQGASLRGLYWRLLILKDRIKNLPHMSTYFFFKNPANTPVVIACCLDDVDYFMQYADKKYYHKHTFELAILAGSNKIAMHILDACIAINKQLPSVSNIVMVQHIDETIAYNYCLILAIRAGNLAMVKTLIEEKEVKISDEALGLAFQFGYYEIFQTLQSKTLSEQAAPSEDPETDDEQVSDTDTDSSEFEDGESIAFIIAMIQSGNVDAFNKSIKQTGNRFSYQPEYLNAAAKSGSVAMFNEVINFWNVKEFRVTTEILTDALSSDKTQLANYLLNPKNGYQFHLTQEILSDISPANNAILFKLLAQFEELSKSVELTIFKNALHLGNDTVYLYLLQKNPSLSEHIAAEDIHEIVGSGNLLLLEELLTKYPTLRDHMTNLVLSKAIMAGSYEMVKFLLDPLNEFNIAIDMENIMIANTFDKIGSIQTLLFAAQLCHEVLGYFRADNLSFQRIEKKLQFTATINKEMTENTVTLLKKYYRDDQAKCSFLNGLDLASNEQQQDRDIKKIRK